MENSSAESAAVLKPSSRARSARSVQDLGHDLAVVGLAAVGAALIQALNAFSRRSRRAENCRNGSMLERDRRDGVLALVAVLGGRLRRRRPHRLGQSGQVRLALQHQQKVLLVGQHVLAELGAQRRQPLGDRRHAACAPWRRAPRRSLTKLR